MAFIPSEEINHIRQSANIVDIISSYINLEPKGKNYFGLCPFHDDHSPSMSVTPDKQIFTCFVCGMSGNVFTFVQNFENVTFLEAVGIVANKIGYNLKVDSSSVKKDHKYYEMMATANKYYTNNLNSALGARAKTYLNERGLTDKTINEFGIGVALNDNNLTKLLLNKGYEEKMMIDLGLSGKSGDVFDIFRNRITFPINNEKGEVIAFAARIYNNEDASKYINSKESIIFKKGHTLFNYDKAKSEVMKTKTVILVEGQMDAIRLYASGIKNVVATMGTALTKEHGQLLKKLNAKIILLMDNDEAGEKSTLACGELLIGSNLNVEVVRLTGEKDPDDYIVKNGVEALKQLLKNPITFFDFKLNILKKNKDLRKADDLAHYINNIIKELNKSDDDILREITINNLSKEFDLDKELLFSKLIKKEAIKEIKPVAVIKPKLTKYKRLCEALLAMMLSDVKYIRSYEQNLGFIPEKEYNQIANDILAFYKLNKNFDLADFISFETNSIYYETVVRIVNSTDSLEPSFEVFTSYLEQIKHWVVEKQISELREKLRNETDINQKEVINDLIIKLKKESEKEC